MAEKAIGMNRALCRVVLCAVMGMQAVSFAGTASVAGKPPERKKIEFPATMVAWGDGLHYLGNGQPGPGIKVEGYAFVHRKPGKEKKAASNLSDDFGKCHSPISDDAVWLTPAPYLLGAANDDGLRENQIARVVAEALETWNRELGFPAFSGEGQGSVDGADLQAPDGRNEIMFASFEDSTIQSMTVVWGFFAAPARMREIVEWDIVLNDDGIRWGDAGPTREHENGDEEILDLLNVLTHEVGHAAGMNHPPRECTEETMFNNLVMGETKKRTLGEGDFEGIVALYGKPEQAQPGANPDLPE
jgi:hypothetical protein